ncbi:MAG: hypothetical protein KGJ09_04040 [Candidatus Omnitrophica bacterium]|nr:hypothetical protein [Candidatus Omnitrophota bacterium]MDE2009231.1 hypothetical protein [Candidatus Omnitrophota bacterium]MDE2213751.1 hypothetical protein [Candidatus Omnitrophota bacterium]MDE2230673.1 hypothetical protein [Candidatus Omnitrophota bacterium]
MCGLSTAAMGWEGHYHFRDGHYYRGAGWWGLGGFVTGLAVGAYVSSLPPRYEIIEVRGVPYYYADGYYYQAGPSGYIVVAPPPTVAVQSNPVVNNSFGNDPMIYVLGTLFGLLLLAAIGLVVKKLMMG